MKLEPLKDKWQAFGFEVEQVDGNDMDKVLKAFDRLQKVNGKPKLILADTVKGKGISFMENNVKWHHGTLNQAEYEQALRELGQPDKGGEA